MFVDPFIDAVKALHWATEKDDATTKLIEFKRFINEFGTHYASTSEMGTKLRLLEILIHRMLTISSQGVQ